jgi:hypothetical protein
MAYVWLHLASIQGNRRAEKNITILAEKMSPEQIFDAKQMIRGWKPKA